MQFCTHHSKDLDNAMASLSLDSSPSPSTDPARNPPIAQPPSNVGHPFTPSPSKQGSPSPNKSVVGSLTPPPPSTELTIILLALRKLREALLATSSAAASPVFSQRVHIFSIRLAIRALHPPSYYPSLLHLLFVLHSPQHPLPLTELSEMTTYLILDLACRQDELARAYGLRSNSATRHGFHSRDVDEVLNAVTTRNWIGFWGVRRRVDGYVRAVMQWAIDGMRRDALKALGRTYMGCDLRWVLQCATGEDMTWEELVRKENVGWIRDGNKIIIRKPKVKGKADGL